MNRKRPDKQPNVRLILRENQACHCRSENPVSILVEKQESIDIYRPACRLGAIASVTHITMIERKEVAAAEVLAVGRTQERRIRILATI